MSSKITKTSAKAVAKASAAAARIAEREVAKAAKAAEREAAKAAKAAEREAAKAAKAAEREAAKAAKAAEREAAKAAKTTLRTEDTGKILEMAVCLAYDTPYVSRSPYKYGMEEPLALQPRLAALPTLFPSCVHTAEQGSRYDFTAAAAAAAAAAATAARYLSAKSTKGNTMVAPQCVGQPQPSAFCKTMGLPEMERPVLKAYIQTNIASLLPTLLDYTISYNCDVLYYNKKTNAMKFIRYVAPIDWSAFTYDWSCTADKWNNSTCLKVRPIAAGSMAKWITLMNWQFHSASRTNMVVRWYFESLLTIAPASFAITDL